MTNNGKFLIYIGAVILLVMMAAGSNTRSTVAPTQSPHSCFDPDYPNNPSCIRTDGDKAAIESLQRALTAAHERKYRAPTPNWVGDAPKYYQCRGAECGGTQ